MQAPELLDRAREHTGSDKATADALSVSSQQLSDWRNGRKPFPITMQARVCELARMTEGEQMRYVWEVVRARMGKPTGAVLGAVAWIGFTAVVCARLVASLGDAALMYKPSGLHTR